MILMFLMVDAFFIFLLVVAYILVTQRRERIYLLVDHLEAMARKGLPLQTGLRMVGRDLGGFFGTEIERVARKVEDGATLGEAFGACPRSLPPLLRSMITLGERSGNLAAFLGELRRSYRRVAEFPYQSVYYFLYPVVLTVMISLALAFLSTWVFPNIRVTLAEVGLGGEYTAWWAWIQVCNVIVFILAVLLAIRVFIGPSPLHFGFSALRALKKVTDRLVLAFPILSRMIEQRSIQLFAVSTGFLLRAGATLPEAVRMAAEGEWNGVLRRKYESLAAQLDEGGSLTEYCQKERWFPDDFLWFVRGGETTGTLSEHLVQAGTHYDTKFRYAAQIASRAVIPFFVLLNGGLVIGIYLATMVPMTEIIRALANR